MFSEMVDMEERIKEKAKVKMALKRVLERAIPENYEIQSILLAFSKILRRLKLKTKEKSLKVKEVP
jgi:regulator of replication initiation timing